MTNQKLALQPVSAAPRTPGECFQRRSHGSERMLAVALGVCVAALSATGVPPAEAKQQCSAAMPANPHGQWWSYRLIDGRKCWYEGKPLLPKSSLEWPRVASEQPRPHSEQPRPNKATDAVADKPGDPLDSEAWALEEPDTFEARWRVLMQRQ